VSCDIRARKFVEFRKTVLCKRALAFLLKNAIIGPTNCKMVVDMLQSFRPAIGILISVLREISTCSYHGIFKNVNQAGRFGPITAE